MPSRKASPAVDADVSPAAADTSSVIIAGYREVVCECGAQGRYSCVDCEIDHGVVIYVCGRSECCDAHEAKYGCEAGR